MVVAALALTGGTAHAGTPTGDGQGNVQQFDVSASPPIAGAGIVYELQQTYWNVLGAPPRAPRSVVIRFPRGTRWNGPSFPQCDPFKLQQRGPAACPKVSRFASAEVVTAAGSQTLLIKATVTDFVGTPVGGHPTQLLWVVPAVGPPLLLTGIIGAQRTGPYGTTLTFDLTPLPGGSALAPSPVVITSIHNVDVHSSVRTRGGRLPLIVAPPTCRGFWSYAFDSVYPGGDVLRSTSRQPCVPRRH